MSKESKIVKLIIALVSLASVLLILIGVYSWIFSSNLDWYIKMILSGVVILPWVFAWSL